MGPQPLPALPVRQVMVPGHSPALPATGAANQGVPELFARPPHRPTNDSDFDNLANQVVELARVLTGANGAAIAFRGVLGTICHARSGEGAPAIGARVDTSPGICKRCLDLGTALRCEDVARAARFDPGISPASGVRAVAVVPIFRGRRVAGILGVFAGAPRVFSELQLRWLQQLAQWVGSGEDVAGGGTVREHESLRATGAVSSRPAARLAPSSRPLPGWHAAFIETRVPWQGFVESLCLHIMIVILVSGLSEFWPRELQISPRVPRDVHVAYYPTSQSFPAYESSRPQVYPARQPASPRAQRTDRERNAGSRRETIRGEAGTAAIGGKKADESSVSSPAVPSDRIPPAALSAPETPAMAGRRRKPAIDAGVVPPPGTVEARMRAARLAEDSVIEPSPEVGGGSGLRRSNPPGAAVVAPSPEIGAGAGLRTSNAPGVAAVAPSPEVSGGSGLRARNAPRAAVIPPSPDARGLAGGAAAVGRGRTGGGSSGGADIDVVPPPPSLAVHATLGFGTRGPGIGNAQVVPAPPAVQTAGGMGGLGRSGGNGSLGNGAMQVVPPPPSAQAGGNFGSRGNGGLDSGSPAVAPAPSALVGDNLGGGRGVGALGGGSAAVPPAPSAQAGAGFGAGRGSGRLGGGGSGVVPPAPSIAGFGQGGPGGRGGSIEVARSVGIQPSSSLSSSAGRNSSSGAGNSSAGGGIEAQSNSAAERVVDLAHRVYQDVQLRVVSLAWAPPRSSYFSNFEVFIAEKWTSKKESQFIKLVYVFLPYQRRLSEFGRDALTTRRLRVTRDATCDESLMQIMWPDAGHSPAGPGGAAGRLASPSDRNNALPCYLTTADDYARARVQSQ